jgi:hypothetical protein
MSRNNGKAVDALIALLADNKKKHHPHGSKDQMGKEIMAQARSDLVSNVVGCPVSKKGVAEIGYAVKLSSEKIVKEASRGADGDSKTTGDRAYALTKAFNNATMIAVELRLNGVPPLKKALPPAKSS